MLRAGEAGAVAHGLRPPSTSRTFAAPARAFAAPSACLSLGWAARTALLQGI